MIDRKRMQGPPVFRAEPEIIEVDESGLGETSLTWEALDSAAVEIRVGSSKGKLLGKGGGSGRMQTGRWVNASTRFYLLDPLTGETLAQTGVRTRPQDESDFGTIELEHKMRRDWNERARDNAFYYVATGQSDWSEEEFFRSGRQTIEDYILSDMTNICRGRDPKQLKILEIGCGVGRVTSALAEVFGEVRGGPHRLDHLAAFLRWTPQLLLPPVREILRGGEPEGKVPLRMFFQASVHLLRRRPSVRRVRSLAVV